jgi:hypothetical protein
MTTTKTHQIKRRSMNSLSMDKRRRSTETTTMFRQTTSLRARNRISTKPSSWTSQSGMTGGLACWYVTSWCCFLVASLTVTVVPSYLRRFRRSIGRRHSRIRENQRIQRRRHIRKPERLWSFYEHDCSIRFLPRGCHRLELWICLAGAHVHETVYMDHRNFEHPFRTGHGNLYAFAKILEWR